MMNSSAIGDALFTKTQQRVLGLLYGNTNPNPNKFSLLPSPKGEGQDEGIYITTFWDWYYLRSWFDKLTHERNHTLPFLRAPSTALRRALSKDLRDNDLNIAGLLAMSKAGLSASSLMCKCQTRCEAGAESFGS